MVDHFGLRLDLKVRLWFDKNLNRLKGLDKPIANRSDHQHARSNGVVWNGIERCKCPCFGAVLLQFFRKCWQTLSETQFLQRRLDYFCQGNKNLCEFANIFNLEFFFRIQKLCQITKSSYHISKFGSDGKNHGNWWNEKKIRQNEKHWKKNSFWRKNFYLIQNDNASKISFHWNWLFDWRISKPMDASFCNCFSAKHSLQKISFFSSEKINFSAKQLQTLHFKQFICQL